MTSAERMQVRLLSQLGDAAARPLSPAQYRHFGMRLLEQEQPEAELNTAVLQRMGYDASAAEWILGLLERDPEPWLRQMEHWGISPLGDGNADYPRRLLEQLGEKAPPLLYGCGNRGLLQKPALSVVGSRRMGAEGRCLAAEAGRWAAERGYVLCTGGAPGVDETAAHACLEAGGCVILYLPADMRPAVKQWRWALHRWRILLLSAAPDGRFYPSLALERNRWIHIQGRAVLVCQCEPGHGGSWRGSEENCRNHWSPVFVPQDRSAGTADLRNRGARPLDWDALQSVFA